MARMDVLRRPLACVLAACMVPATAEAAAWRAVPGASELEIAAGSLQQEGPRVSAWLRTWGRSALVPELAGWNARAPRVHRTLLRTEFDCGRRSLRVLAAHAYGSDGAPLFLSGTAGPWLPVPEADLAWAYDAVCEAARSGARL